MSEFVRLTLAPLFSLALLQLNEEAGIVNRLLVDKWKALTSQFIQTTMRNTASDYEVSISKVTFYYFILSLAFAHIKSIR